MKVIHGILIEGHNMAAITRLGGQPLCAGSPQGLVACYVGQLGFPARAPKREVPRTPSRSRAQSLRLKLVLNCCVLR